MFKQIIIIRKDLNLSLGKACAQASHASLGAYKKSSSFTKKMWSAEGEKKVVLKADNDVVLRQLEKKAQKEKLPVYLVRDAGRTELKPGTVTALGIGPAREGKIDKITGSLPLFN
jgi:PTH2 family peptidyl-tRNA hydrolase